MKKIVFIILFSIIIVSFLGLFMQTVLLTPAIRKNNKNFKNYFPDEYITDNQRKIDILHYNLEFDLYPENKRMIASAEITGIILEKSITSIDLNFYDNFEINKVTLNDEKTDYISDGKSFSIPQSSVLDDTFTVKITYEGTPQKSGLAGFVFGKRDGIPLVYTLSEPTYASSWFPCNDIPTDKTLLDMKITNDSSMVSVSNGILVSEKYHGARKTYHWKTLYPISTYLIALYSSDYETFSHQYVSIDGKDTMSLEYYILPDKLENAKVDFAEHVDILKYFAEIFGEYPFIKEKYGIAEFLWRSGAMENQTITGVASSLIGGKKFFLDFYVHELAHHWWGNAVGPKSWKDIWLNEGFSSYSEALYFEYKGGAEALQSTMREKYLSSFSGNISEPGSHLFTNTIYDKGAWVLHMLRWEVGDSTFFRILREYFNQYKYSNASTSDFIEICERVSKKSLQKFFHQWLVGEGEIELEYKVTTIKEMDLFKTILNIEQVQEEYKYYEFSLEVRLNFSNSEPITHKIPVNSKCVKFEVKTNTEPILIEIDPNNWLLASITEE